MKDLVEYRHKGDRIAIHIPEPQIVLNHENSDRQANSWRGVKSENVAAPIKIQRENWYG
jgi:hypothetical protein